MQTIAIVDFGMGNLRSVEQAVRYVTHQETFSVCVTDRPETVLKADRIILPGQGAMPDCMKKLEATGLNEAILEVIRQGKPLLGICLGMQMLLEGSEEGASPTQVYTPSLNVLKGISRYFDLSNLQQEDGSRYKVPQIGWNQVDQTQKHPLWENIPDAAWFYFSHSYYAQLAQKEYSAGETLYGLKFTSVIAYDTLFATQFHPEKSAQAGLQLFRNFLHWYP